MGPLPGPSTCINCVTSWSRHRCTPTQSLVPKKRGKPASQVRHPDLTVAIFWRKLFKLFHFGSTALARGGARVPALRAGAAPHRPANTPPPPQTPRECSNIRPPPRVPPPMHPRRLLLQSLLVLPPQVWGLGFRVKAREHSPQPPPPPPPTHPSARSLLRPGKRRWLRLHSPVLLSRPIAAMGCQPPATSSERFTPV